jgi:hypothetical protein
MPEDGSALLWAKWAIHLSLQGGLEYRGKSSPHWYDAQSFYDLLHWSGDRPVRELISNLDGCSGEAAGQITAQLKGRTGASLERHEATALLLRARLKAKAPTHKRLGAVGDVMVDYYYATKSGTVELGVQNPKAQIPFVVEAWAKKIDDRKGGTSEVTALVNRTPITGSVRISPDGGGKPTIWECGLRHHLDIPAKGTWSVRFNLTAPFVPITTDGKEPDLSLFADEIVGAVSLAIKRAHKAAPKANGSGITTRDAVWENMQRVVDEATDGGRLLASQRQCMYGMRPISRQITGKDLADKYFNSILTDYENEHGEFENLYRDNRGALYVPWSNRDVPVGTIMSRSFERPVWTFGAILYIEKQALFESLKAEKFPRAI